MAYTAPPYRLVRVTIIAIGQCTKNDIHSDMEMTKQSCNTTYLANINFLLRF